MEIKARVGIVPGDDESHARSAAHFVRECISHAMFLDLPTGAQTSDTVFTFLMICTRLSLSGRALTDKVVLPSAGGGQNLLAQA